MNEAISRRNRVITSRNITCVTFQFFINRLVFVAQLQTRKFRPETGVDATAALAAVFGQG
jgi:hypothetical protein